MRSQSKQARGAARTDCDYRDVAEATASPVVVSEGSGSDGATSQPRSSFSIASIAKRTPWAHVAILGVIFFAWGAYVYSRYPGRAIYGDELQYVSVALNFSDHGSLNTKSYYFASLLKQSPPLRDSHNPGYPILLGSYFKLAGIHSGNILARESSILYFNFAAIAALLAAYYRFAKREFGGARPALIGAALLLCTPMVVQYSLTFMAEITVLSSTFLLFLLMFDDGGKPRGLAYLALVAVVFWFCYLIRENVVFILPIYVACLWRRQGLPGLSAFLLILLAMSPAVYYLSDNRIEYPFAFVTDSLPKAKNLGETFDLLAGNVWQNVKYAFAFFPEGSDARYGITKLSFDILAALAVLSYPMLNKRQREFYFIIMAFFAMNTLALFLFYDNTDWRELRVSIQFIPLFLALVVGAAWEFRSRQRSGFSFAYAGLAIVLFVSSAPCAEYDVDYTVKELKQSYVETDVIEKILRHFLARDHRQTVLASGMFERGQLLFPEAEYVMFWEAPSLNNFDVVDHKMNFDFVLIAPSSPSIPYLAARGFKLRTKYKGFRLYARQNCEGPRPSRAVIPAPRHRRTAIKSAARTTAGQPERLAVHRAAGR